MNFNKIRLEILERLNQIYEDGVDHLNIEDIEDCVGDIMSTYGIKLVDIENMIVYEENYHAKLYALNHDRMYIKEL